MGHTRMVREGVEVKRETSALAFVALGAIPWIGLSAPEDAAACTEATPYLGRAWSTDTPDCVEFTESIAGETHAVIYFDNNCDETLQIEVVSCEACGDGLEIAAGEGNWGLILEDRAGENDRLSEQTLRWILGQDEGTIEAYVEYSDTSDACDGWDRGCTMAPGSAHAGAWLLLAGLLARRRRGR